MSWKLKHIYVAAKARNSRGSDNLIEFPPDEPWFVDNDGTPAGESAADWYTTQKYAN
jgi:hypothetical protein